MTPGRRAAVTFGRRAAVTAVLACLLATVLAGGAGAPTASAADATLPVRVLLDTLTPAIPGPGDVLHVTGRLQNTGPKSLAEPLVRLRDSPTKVSTRAQLESLATGETARLGYPVSASAESLGDLAPGASAAFDLTVPLDPLGFADFGVYPIAVEVRSAGVRTGITWTFVPWAPDPLLAEPTQVAWIWPLADVPRRTVEGAFVDDVLARELSAGGRLGSLVQAGAGRTVTWVVDPMLLEDAQDMSDGYGVRTTGSAGRAASTSPGTGDEAARHFLDDLRAASGGAPVVALPYADPDVVALTRAGMTAQLRSARLRSAEVAPRVLARPGTSSTALPPGGFLDAATARELAATGTSSVVLRDDALPASTPLDFTPTGRASVAVGGGSALDALLVDTRLSALAGADTSLAGTRVLAQQRFLAETAMVTAERPGVRRTIAIAPPARWAPQPGWAASLLTLTEQAPWLTAVPLPAALATPVPDDVSRGPLRYPQAARAAELPAGYLTAVAGLRRAVTATSEVLSDPASIVDPYAAQELRLVSAGLRRDTDRRAGLLRRTRDTLAAQIAAVHVIPTKVSLGARDGSFPVTVVNGLPQAVTVRVSVSADSPRLRVDESAPVTIDARGQARVLLAAHAVANGVTEVSAQLRTPTGDPFGSPVAIPVQVAQYGLVGVVVAVAAALLLFLAAGRQIVRRARGRGRPADPGDGDQPRQSEAAVAGAPVAAATRGRHVG